MEFYRVIGKIDQKLVQKAQEKLHKVFLELGTRYTNEHVGTCMGGDPLIFSLMYPIQHVCTNNISTAATDGKRYYWNPKFIIKLSRIGLRIVCAHEAWHAIYMHPQRRGSRLPKLWNIAVDFIVNNTIMEDFKNRHMNPEETFQKHLGKFMTLEQYAEMLKDPFKTISGFEGLTPDDSVANPNVKLPGPNEDRELTPEEIKELERREKKERFFYADPNLVGDMRRPEKVYDYLYSLLPKCPDCGRVGMYKRPDTGKDKKKQQGQSKGGNAPGKSPGDSNSPGAGKGNQPGNSGHGQQGQGQGQGQPGGKGGQGQSDQQDANGQDPNQQDQNSSHDHGDGQPCNCPHGASKPQDPNGPCGTCGGGIDIFGFGDTLDDHIDTEESPEKLAKRVADAMMSASKMAGRIPSALEDELGKLTAPKITWKDLVRTRLLKARAGNGRNNWSQFRSRPMFAGLLVPKRRDYKADFGCLLDTSGSMRVEDMAFGISQLASLDEKSEGTVVPADATIYWDKATKIKKISPEELSKIKIVGRGGTLYAEFFEKYEENIGKCDFLIVITDGFLDAIDIANMKHPGIDVIWLITSGVTFDPPFGRAFDLRNI